VQNLEYLKKMNRHKIKLYKEERMWFFVALTVLLSMFALYIYFVSASVVHVVMRKEINSEISRISSSVGQLESQYIETQYAVSAGIALLEGYKEVDKKIFIDRTTTSLVLSTNNDS